MRTDPREIQREAIGARTRQATGRERGEPLRLNEGVAISVAYSYYYP